MNAPTNHHRMALESRMDHDAAPASRRRGASHAAGGQRAAAAEIRALSAQIAKEGPLPPERAISLVRKAARKAADGRHAKSGSLVFSLGVLLFVALTGRAPQQALAQDDISPPSPSAFSPYAVHPSLDAVVRMCLAAQPDDRFSSPAELNVALSALAIGQSGTLDHTAERRPSLAA